MIRLADIQKKRNHKKKIAFQQGCFFDIELDFKGDPLAAHISYCKYT